MLSYNIVTLLIRLWYFVKEVWRTLINDWYKVMEKEINFATWADNLVILTKDK